MSDIPVTIIQPRRGWAGLGLAELWRYRDLLWTLAWRDVKVRYKQTILGAAWAVIQPITMMVIFTIFFGGLGKMPSDGLPYAVFSFAALVPWTYFAGSLVGAANSIVEHRAVITKVYFPRLILPIAPLISELPDLGVALAVLLGIMAWYGIVPGPQILALPAFLLLAMLTALAAGLWIAGLNALYRDFRYTIGFIVQVWLLASPVAYPASLVEGWWKWAYGLNPMAGVIEGFRWCLLSEYPKATVASPGPMVAVSAVVTLLALAGGIEFFRRLERTFVDRV